MGIVVYFPAVAPPEAQAGSGPKPNDVAVTSAVPPTTFSSHARRDVDGFDTSKLDVKFKKANNDSRVNFIVVDTYGTIVPS